MATRVSMSVVKSLRQILATGGILHFNDVYPTGGFDLSGLDFGLPHVSCVIPLENVTESGYIASCAGDHMKFFRTGGTNSVLQEVPAGTDFTAETLQVLVLSQ